MNVKRMITTFSILATAALGFSDASAQNLGSSTADAGHVCPCPGKGMGASRKYDPTTVETIQGSVVSVDRVGTAGRGKMGVHLTVQTDKETLPVMLGPAWYVDRQEMTFSQGDQIEVTGSRITYQGQPALVAAQVRKGDQVLTLRDEKGIPAWSRGRGPHGSGAMDETDGVF